MASLGDGRSDNPDGLENPSAPALVLIGRCSGWGCDEFVSSLRFVRYSLGVSSNRKRARSA